MSSKYNNSRLTNSLHIESLPKGTSICPAQRQTWHSESWPGNSCWKSLTAALTAAPWNAEGNLSLWWPGSQIPVWGQAGGSEQVAAWDSQRLAAFHQTGEKNSHKENYFAHYEALSINMLMKYILLTAKEAPTGLRTHLGGFFRGGTIVSWTVGWGTCRGGSTCPVPKGSIVSNEEDIC